MSAKLLLSVMLGAALLSAQSSTGQVRGVVVDVTGASVPGATVVLLNKDTRAGREVKTEASGQFLFPSLPIGTYSLRVEAAGMTGFRIDSFLVSVGQTVNQRVEMSPAAVSEKLEVTAEADVLQASATTANVALGYDRIEETPSQNRNYLSFVFAAPGISPSNGSSTGRSATGMRNVANDSGFVAGGMRGRNNSITIDGVDNRDETTGANRVAIGLEMVQEFRVAGAGISAEQGGAAGGLVNVVTRAGTNVWHGDATMFFQNERLNTRNPEIELTRKNRFRRSQPGTSLMGPLRKDRTFFATAVEGTWESGEEWSETPVVIPGLVAASKVPAIRALSPTLGVFPSTTREASFSFKFQHALSDRHSFTSRYAYSRGHILNDVLGLENFSDASSRGSSLVGDHSWVSGVVSMFTPRRINDLRVQVSRRVAEVRPNSISAMYEIPGVVSLGTGYRLEQKRTESHYEIVDSFSATMGRHLVTFGGNIHWIPFEGELANRFRGLFVFPTLEDFRLGLADVYAQSFGTTRTSFSTLPAGVFVHDHWQLANGLTVDAGLRFDRQRMPDGVSSSTNNLAPRFGLAWRPKSSPWVFRAGTGLFFDRYPLGYLNDAIQKNGLSGYELYATGTAATAILQGAPLSFLQRSTYRTASYFPSTYSTKVTAGMERALNADTTLNVEYSFVRGIALPRIRNVSDSATPKYLLEQTARSRYQGVTATVNRRLAKEFTYLLAYTAGRTLDDASDFDEQPMDPRNTRRDWALSRQHQLHRVTLSALLEWPLADKKWMPEFYQTIFEGFDLAPMFSFGSGRPLNVLDSTDSFRTGAYPISARPFDLGRNPFYGPSTKSVDLRVFKTIKVKEGRALYYIGAEAFNLLNHTNPLRVSATYSASGVRLSSYRQPIEYMNSRQIQLFVAFEY